MIGEYCTICGELDTLLLGRRVRCCWRPQCLSWLTRLGVHEPTARRSLAATGSDRPAIEAGPS